MSEERGDSQVEKGKSFSYTLDRKIKSRIIKNKRVI